jgi:hypothetical protein
MKFLYTFPVLPIRTKMTVPTRPHPLILSPYNIWQNVRIIKSLIRKSSRLLLLPVMSRHFLAFESCSGTRLWLLQVLVFFGRPCRWIQGCYLKVRPRPFPCISCTIHCSLILSWGAISSELLTASLKTYKVILQRHILNDTQPCVLPTRSEVVDLSVVSCVQDTSLNQMVSSVVLFRWSADSVDHVPLHH